jgi:ectoine hydroxylase-related dioxygenase (phytanoyl-CoA dioxygenase family)
MSPNPLKSVCFLILEPVYHLDARFDALIDDPRIWGPCRALVGCEELSLFSDKLNVKRPGGAPFPWHQEGPYWAHGAERLDAIVSVLIYLDEATTENGCLWVIPGSHKHGALSGLKNRGVLGALYTDVDLVEGEALPTVLPSGSVLWFHRDLVHGSQQNRSDSNRRVFVLAYQPAGLRRWRLDKQRPVRSTHA